MQKFIEPSGKLAFPFRFVTADPKIELNKKEIAF
jgi:hypothetical protein